MILQNTRIMNNFKILESNISFELVSETEKIKNIEFLKELIRK